MLKLSYRHDGEKGKKMKINKRPKYVNMVCIKCGCTRYVVNAHTSDCGIFLSFDCCACGYRSSLSFNSPCQPSHQYKIDDYGNEYYVDNKEKRHYTREEG